MDAGDLLDLGTFVQRHWRAEPLVRRGAPWEGFPGLEDVDRLLALSRWDPGEIRLERPDAPDFPCLYERGRDLPDGAPDLGRIHLAWARGGYTLRLRHVDRRWPVLDRLRRSLEQVLEARAEATLLLFPRDAPPQPIDPCHLLLLVLHGALRVDGDPLAAGDLLYRPAGSPPVLAPDGSSALVLAISLHPHTWRDLARAALRAGCDDAPEAVRCGRPALPAGHCPGVAPDGPHDPAGGAANALLHPLGLEAFLREHRGTRPLHLARDEPERYADLLRLADLDGLIALSRAAVRVPGAPFPLVHPFHPERRQEGEPDLARLVEAVDRGCPLEVDGVERRRPAVAALARALAEALRSPVTARVRLTPPGAPPEEVPGEVLLLGLHGRQSLGDHDLAAGDLLYLPEGDTLEARPPDRLALRLDLRVAGLEERLLAALEALPGLDEPLPKGALTADPASLTPRLREILADLRWREEPREQP